MVRLNNSTSVLAVANASIFRLPYPRLGVVRTLFLISPVLVLSNSGVPIFQGELFAPTRLPQCWTIPNNTGAFVSCAPGQNFEAVEFASYGDAATGSCGCAQFDQLLKLPSSLIFLIFYQILEPFVDLLVRCDGANFSALPAQLWLLFERQYYFLECLMPAITKCGADSTVKVLPSSCDYLLGLWSYRPDDGGFPWRYQGEKYSYQF